MVAPIAVWPIPRSWDLVNHWARLTLYHLPAGDPLAALYQVRLTLIPNLAIDLVYLALSPIFSAESVICLAWVAAIALPAWGAWRLNKALYGAPQPIVLVAPALSYNLVTTLGLINFALGMALAIHAFAWWLTIDRRRRWTRLAIFNGVAAALFFCHIAAYAAFCLIVGLLRSDAAIWRGPSRAGLRGSGRRRSASGSAPCCGCSPFRSRAASAGRGSRPPASRRRCSSRVCRPASSRRWRWRSPRLAAWNAAC